MLHVHIHEKTMGSKTLLNDFELRVEHGEKVGFLGRNGTGKTTLFTLLTGQDTDFDGSITLPKHLSLMATSQEHEIYDNDNTTTLDHITSKLPDFSKLQHIINTYPTHMGEDMKKLESYSEALQRFSDLGYYEIENSLSKYFDAYQLPLPLLSQPFRTLSGGQKRLSELTAIQVSEPHVALLDEPTNHMDYVGKAAFIQWLRSTKSAVFVISHDRDVLHTVDRIIELKDKKAHSFNGNYDAYLYQNASKTTSDINEYEIAEKRIKNIQEQIAYANSRAPGYKGKAGKNPWVVMRERLQRDLDGIIASHDKPSFWIDSESAKNLKTKASTSYEKYKARNIKLTKSKTSHAPAKLLTVEGLSLGYDKKSPLFDDCSFSLTVGDRMHIIGRNGVGKTTLIKSIVESYNDQIASTILQGSITCMPTMRLSLYEQEVGPELLTFTLFDAVEKILRDKQVRISEQAVLQTMSNYLFEPATDRETLVSALSGGQKARLQLIRMLAGDPNILILDEPTNHLDLPSIEELESHLKSFTGAILYISHDSYFAKSLGGTELALSRSTL